MMTADDYARLRRGLGNHREHVIREKIGENWNGRITFFLTWCGLKAPSNTWLFQNKEHAVAAKEKSTVLPCLLCWKAIKEDQ